MTFLYPHVLIALVAPVLLALLALLRHRSSGHGWRRLVSPAHPELVHRRPGWQVALPTLLALLALIGIILAAARPINGYEQSEGSATGRNLLIALDISRSMETQDVSPSRLEEARAAAYELIDALPGDKIGLIVFSGEADVVVPLTYDHTALRDALEQVNRSWAGVGGTNFGLLLRKAMQNLSRSAPDGANALVILSDGEDTVDSSLQIAEEAKQSNLLVITVGIGTPAGGPIPDRQGENGLWQDASGRHVISKLDVAALRRFSDATGGSFFAMSSGADLSAFAREAVEKLDRHEESFATGRVPNDLFGWFALPALLALLAAILLGTEWRAPRHTALLALLVFSAAAQALPPPQAYEQAVLALKEGKTDEAREMFSEALLADAPALQAAAHLALGNMQTRSTFDKLRSFYAAAGEDANAPAQPSIDDLQAIVDKLKKDIIPYRDALAAEPSLTAASENTAKVEEFIKKLEEEIERLKQQQNEQNQQDKNDQQQGDQDQQDKNDRQQGDQDQQDKNDQQQGDQNQQDKNDRQQGDQNQQDKNDQQQGDQGQQDKDDQQQGDRQNEQQQQAMMQQAQEVSDEEKTRQRAASILRMHLEEEQGSPIPHDKRGARPPAKDY